MAVDDNDAGIASYVTQRLVVWARDYVAAIRAHEAEF